MLREEPPPPNVIEFPENVPHNINKPLSEIMAEQQAEICCPICAHPLPLKREEVKEIILDGARWMACKSCNL